MDLLIRRHDQWLFYYNCSAYDYESIPLHERQDMAKAFVYVILFLVSETIYIPCVYALFQPKLRRQFCYKIMLILCMMDMFSLPVTALATAYFSFTGAVFCTNPLPNYLCGLWLYSVWMGYSLYAILLAFNRCISFTKYSGIFEGHYESLWLAIPFAYFVYSILWGIPVTFNGYYTAWFFNPHVAYLDDHHGYFVNRVHTADNISTAIIIPVIYLTFACRFRGFRNNLTTMTGERKRNDYSLFMQVFYSSLILSAACTGYVAIQFIELPRSIFWTSHLVYVISQVLPGIIYLTKNKTIRAQIVNRYISSVQLESSGNYPATATISRGQTLPGHQMVSSTSTDHSNVNSSRNGDF